MLSFSASDNFPKTDINFADLLVHAAMYGMLTIIMLYERHQIDKNHQKDVKWMLPVLIVPTIVGILTELVQYLWIESRTGEVADGVANVAGAAIVVLVYRMFTLRLHQ